MFFFLILFLDTSTSSKWSQCQFCKLVITTVNLWRHIRTQHTDQPPLQCEYCQKSFKNKYSKREHIRKFNFLLIHHTSPKFETLKLEWLRFFHLFFDHLWPFSVVVLLLLIVAFVDFRDYNEFFMTMNETPIPTPKIVRIPSMKKRYYFNFTRFPGIWIYQILSNSISKVQTFPFSKFSGIAHEKPTKS